MVNCVVTQAHNRYVQAVGLMKPHARAYVLHGAVNLKDTYCLRIEFHSLTHSRSWALLEEPLIVQLLKNFPAFLEPEGSLPGLKEPSTDPYPKTDRSSLYNPIISL
jgi:hypothetical protein